MLIDGGQGREAGGGKVLEYEIHALYAAMPPEDQMRAFVVPRPGVRKFVLATNIAETSVTIAGIKYGAHLCAYMCVNV